MFRVVIATFLLAASLLAASFKLYLKDGNYHIVREYSVTGDRVRYYSVERSEWEEIPVSLVDLKRTEAELKANQEQLARETAEITAEEKFEREQREERERVPMDPGAYLVEGKELRTIKQAESKLVTDRRRSILKVLAPVPVVSGKATVELDGERSATVITAARPEFYFRLASEERFGMVRLGSKKGVRVVQKWTIVPVTKEIVEEQQEVELFRKQVQEGLYKIWPEKPLEPGEYAIVEYEQGKGNVQVWDFAYRPAPR